jgi:hypothetical protein
MAIELIVATLAALGSLGTGLFHRLKASSPDSEKSDQVTVTVVRGQETIERQAAMRPDETSKVLDMVPETVPQDRTHLSAR